jgi:2-polyprenyl-6-hydroxyphenyl methylase/3-demethylubiquinone-9 3-methyltransferase
MESRTALGSLAELAALARIRELERRWSMSGSTKSTLEAGPRAMWALGDYHSFAKATVWELGPVLVEACGVRMGQRVLDVAAGTGNTAIRAAQRGASVVASDLTPENFAAGRGEAQAAGVELEWVEADAQALPFSDEEFDVVTSSFGAIFAPDHQAVADELVRVCKPGGTIGMINFTPRADPFFGLLGRYLPPPPAGAQPPTAWGSEEHVRELFGDRVELDLARRTYVERADTPDDYAALFKETFGPVIAIEASLDPERAAAFDREFHDFALAANDGPPEGPAEYTYEYLLVVGRRA